MPAYPTVDDLDVAARRVLVRADLNVPIKDGVVGDQTRIERTVPGLRELAAKGARVIVMSHLGRPKGKPSTEFSLRPVADALARALGAPVAFAADCIGPEAAHAVDALKPGSVLLLENLRFHAGEEKNDPAFAKELAAHGDLYVNDAFSAAHRAHASTEALARLLPHAAGRLMQQELEALAHALESPKRPVAALVGGAKISTKLDVLGHLVTRAQILILGGGMANTFLHARGVAVGRSLCERDMADAANTIAAKAKAAGCELVLPLDAVVAERLAEGVTTRVCAIDAVPADQMILDVGPQTIADLKRRLGQCRTLLWNGPLGAFETRPFDEGTNQVAVAAAQLTGQGQLLSVAGGGDTVAALAHAGVGEKFSYVSTAGGAFLEWLEGRELPGVAALAR
jgi:phosphoglycerate kinase